MLSEYGYVYTDKKISEPWEENEYRYHLEDYGKGTFGRDSGQAAITYQVEYQFLDRFLDVVLGKTVRLGPGQLSRSNTSGDFDSINGSLPEEHPNFPGRFAATAEVSVPPKAVTTTDLFGKENPQYDKAFITVVFRPVDYNVIGDDIVDTEDLRFCSVKRESSIEFQTAMGAFYFVQAVGDDGKHRALDLTPGFTVATTKYNWVWRQIPVVERSDGYPDLVNPPNADLLVSLAGSVNSQTFAGKEPGTMLYVGAVPTLINPQTATANQYYWDIAFQFSERDYGVSPVPFVTGEHMGWNYAFDPLNKRWDLYTTDGTTTGGTMYKYADLNDLFVIP